MRYRFDAAIEDLYSPDPAKHVEAASDLQELASTVLDSAEPLYELEDLDDDSLGFVGDAAVWLAVLASSGLLPHAVAHDVPRSNALLQAAADAQHTAAHLALAYRYETGFGLQQSCDLAYVHLKVRMHLGLVYPCINNLRIQQPEPASSS